MHLDYVKTNGKMPYLEMISKFNNLASVVAPDNLSFGRASVGIIANFTYRKQVLNLLIKIREKKT